MLTSALVPRTSRKAGRWRLRISAAPDSSNKINVNDLLRTNLLKITLDTNYKTVCDENTEIKYSFHLNDAYTRAYFVNTCVSLILLRRATTTPPSRRVERLFIHARQSNTCNECVLTRRQVLLTRYSVICSVTSRYRALCRYSSCYTLRCVHIIVSLR